MYLGLNNQKPGSLRSCRNQALVPGKPGANSSALTLGELLLTPKLLQSESQCSRLCRTACQSRHYLPETRQLPAKERGATQVLQPVLLLPKATAGWFLLMGKRSAAKRTSPIPEDFTPTGAGMRDAPAEE